jgi:serine/threonine protein kinase
MSAGDADDANPASISTDIVDEATIRARSSHIGQTINERYVIDREIGRGGIGAVYLARDLKLLSKPVVIKVIHEQLEGSDQGRWFKQKFQQEVEALARIDHPGVVGVLDTGQTPDGKACLVMQFVEGQTLHSAIGARGMELTRVANIVRQVSQAVGAAHEKGVYHRDIKPPNIMLQRLGAGDEHVKLIDFGIATVKDSQTASSKEITKAAGTVEYMAPEQLMGRPSAASDIYALGVVAYEMVTGERPFHPDSPYELLELQRAGVKVKPADLRPDLPDAAEAVILKALSFDPNDRYTRATDFGEALADELTSPRMPSRTVTLPSPESLAEPAETQLVLLYKRDSQPDEQLLSLLETQLVAQGYRLFIDRHLKIGIEWAKEIERQLRSADAVIVLLSAASVSSEMLAYEVQVAQEAAQERGKPRLLPIRVSYQGPLPDSVAGILGPIQHAVWNGPNDTQQVLERLLAALRAPAQPLATRRKLEPVGGAMPLDSRFYIVRPTDEEFGEAIARRESIVLVKGARQMGKTSLLARGLQQARQSGARVVLTDLQMLNAVHFQSLERFFLTLAEAVAEQLELEVLPGDSWNPQRGPSINFTSYIRREVLGKLSAPLVWGLDEVDRLFGHNYASEVFGLFRSWHNARALDPSGPWHRLTLAIVYATEAHLFITDINQSPFNVGTPLTLQDFTIEQVDELNRRYGSPLTRPAELARFFSLVAGHPYLVRRALHELAARNITLAFFESKADRDEGPLGDHLRRLLVLLSQDAALCDAVRGVLQGRPCSTPESFYRLRSAGVLVGDSAEEARLRCGLYATYLTRHLL